jgi:hypothetical protein
MQDDSALPGGLKRHGILSITVAPLEVGAFKLAMGKILKE